MLKLTNELAYNQSSIAVLHEVTVDTFSFLSVSIVGAIVEKYVIIISYKVSSFLCKVTFMRVFDLPLSLLINLYLDRFRLPKCAPSSVLCPYTSLAFTFQHMQFLNLKTINTYVSQMVVSLSNYEKCRSCLSGNLFNCFPSRFWLWACNATWL